MVVDNECWFSFPSVLFLIFMLRGLKGEQVFIDQVIDVLRFCMILRFYITNM